MFICLLKVQNPTSKCSNYFFKAALCDSFVWTMTAHFTKMNGKNKSEKLHLLYVLPFLRVWFWCVIFVFLLGRLKRSWKQMGLSFTHRKSLMTTWRTRATTTRSEYNLFFLSCMSNDFFSYLVLTPRELWAALFDRLKLNLNLSAGSDALCCSGEW